MIFTSNNIDALTYEWVNMKRLAKRVLVKHVESCPKSSFAHKHLTLYFHNHRYPSVFYQRKYKIVILTLTQPICSIVFF